MGEAKQRGTYEERKAQAIESGKGKPKKHFNPIEIIPGSSISPLRLDKKLGMFGLTRWHKKKRH